MRRALPLCGDASVRHDEAVLIRLLIAISFAFAAADALADAPPFAAVQDVLRTHCVDCHSRDGLEGGVGLDSYYHATQPTDAGESLIVPGKPDESVLLRVLIEEHDEHRMPKYGDRLADAEIAAVRDWIRDDGRWPDDGWRPPRHWSLVAPQPQAFPPADPMLAGRDGNVIDRFVAARLASEGLAMNPAAEPERLVRRVSLDLTGLPPSIAEVDSFAADPSFTRYIALVDRLLASPAFGERWASHWLDLARYADSEGYQRDSPRSMWAYRDWVIDALNDDVPFDRFTIEQLAGDLLPEPSESQLVATAFHRNAATNLEAGTDPREDRYKTIVDRVNTTGTIWLGLTVGCAQCHNHKYDPLTAKEYYELYAFFDRTPMETRQLGDEMGMSGLEVIGPSLAMQPSSSERTRLAAERDAVAAALKEAETAIRDAIAERVGRKPELRESFSETISKRLAMRRPWTAAIAKAMLKDAAGNRPRGLATTLDRLVEAEQRLERWETKTVRVMADGPLRETFVAKRGDFLSPGVRVSPGTPAALHPMADGLPRSRLGLASWLVDPANPLVARAMVNRLWIELFGQGLLTTPGDFGTQGAEPSHRELLDELAVRFVTDDGWSLKRTLRRIALSATYRQSVAVRPEALRTDPRNQLLWRHPGHRLAAEMIRDNALAIGGLLSTDRGGPSVRPPQPDGVWRKTAGAGERYYAATASRDRHRRGVYTIWRRNAHYASFATFDAPDRTACTVQRDVSNTPLQALTLLNDPVYVEIAAAFGSRIAGEGGADADSRIDWAFRTAVARRPAEPERAVLREAYEQVATTEGETAACAELATILLNLHETIHRN